MVSIQEQFPHVPDQCRECPALASAAWRIEDAINYAATGIIAQVETHDPAAYNTMETLNELFNEEARDLMAGGYTVARDLTAECSGGPIEISRPSPFRLRKTGRVACGSHHAIAAFFPVTGYEA